VRDQLPDVGIKVWERSRRPSLGMLPSICRLAKVYDAVEKSRSLAYSSGGFMS
jgi:hypothetical protein